MSILLQSYICIIAEDGDGCIHSKVNIDLYTGQAIWSKYIVHVIIKNNEIKK